MNRKLFYLLNNSTSKEEPTINPYITSYVSFYVGYTNHDWYMNLDYGAITIKMTQSGLDDYYTTYENFGSCIKSTDGAPKYIELPSRQLLAPNESAHKWITSFNMTIGQLRLNKGSCSSTVSPLSGSGTLTVYKLLESDQNNWIECGSYGVKYSNLLSTSVTQNILITDNDLMSVKFVLDISSYVS